MTPETHHNWQAMLSKGFAVLGILLAMAAVTVGVVRSQQAIDRINSERSHNTLVACLDLNQRHDDTLDEIDRLVAKAKKKSPERAKQIEASKGPTVLLIDALAPKRKCKELAAKAVGGS